MKTCLRLCLIALISLALPLSALAGRMPVAEPCPMQAMDPAMLDAMDPDCCQDLDSHGEHGKACKSGQDCKTGSMLQVATLKPAVTRSSSLAGIAIIESISAQPPAGLWRPPRT